MIVLPLDIKLQCTFGVVDTETNSIIKKEGFNVDIQKLDADLFKQAFESLEKITMIQGKFNKVFFMFLKIQENLPVGASLPALGLSNKALFMFNNEMKRCIIANNALLKKATYDNPDTFYNIGYFIGKKAYTKEYQLCYVIIWN